MNIFLKMSAKLCLQAVDICLVRSFSLHDVVPELEMRMSCLSEIDQVDDLLFIHYYFYCSLKNVTISGINIPRLL